MRSGWSGRRSEQVDHVAFARPPTASAVLREVAVSEDPSASLLLAKTIKRYRESMTGCLEASQAGDNGILKSAEFSG